MKQYQAYLFDFDGTLFNTLASLISVYEKGLAAVGQTCTPAEAAEYIHISLEEMGRRRGLNEADRLKVIEAVDKVIDEPDSLAKVVIYDDVAKTIGNLLKEHKIVAIVSGNNVPHIENVLARFGLEDLFSFIVGASLARKPKPSGDPIFAARSLLPNLNPSSICYIGDSLQDPLTARNGGVDGILLERNGEYKDYEGVKIKSLLELLDAPDEPTALRAK
jgi:HAD superfamily hydrolase (TIGR01549 family)